MRLQCGHVVEIGTTCVKTDVNPCMCGWGAVSWQPGPSYAGSFVPLPPTIRDVCNYIMRQLSPALMLEIGLENRIHLKTDSHCCVFWTLQWKRPEHTAMAVCLQVYLILESYFQHKGWAELTHYVIANIPNYGRKRHKRASIGRTRLSPPCPPPTHTPRGSDFTQVRPISSTVPHCSLI